MSRLPNPFVGLPQAAHDVIEGLFSDLWRSGEWTDEHEDLLDQWRAARGETLMNDWAWWAGEDCDEPYAHECNSREHAIECGRREFDADFRIVEARSWADSVKDGDDWVPFAMTRNFERVRLADNDAQ